MTLRKNLINIIASCDNKEVRKKWIIELSNMSEIECSEGQCDSCLIASECIPTMQSIYDEKGDLVTCQA